MYDFFRKNNKKLMALFGAVLMVAFLIPSMRTASMSSDQQVGTIGKQKIYHDDLLQAQEEWDFLEHRVVFRSQSPGESQWQTILARLPQELVQSVSHDPDTMYFLLMTEAKQMGLTPLYEQADSILSDPQSPYAIMLADNRVVPFADVDDESIKAGARQTVADLAMVMAAFNRAAQVVKISQPLINHELALRLQNIKSRVVDFPVTDYNDKVPAPTTQQLQEQFDKYAKVEAGSDTSDANPFGFGYKYPNRVKIQYLSITRAQVRQAIQASKDDYGWEVEANRYYLEHQGEFPTTAPSTMPVPFALAATTQRGPTTKPFAEVRDLIMTRLIDPLVDRLILQIQSELTNRLMQDYQNYRSVATTSPTTTPAQQAFESFEYFQKLAQDIQSKYKVLPSIASIADEFKTAAQLRDLPGIGKVPSFPDYATAAVEPFVPEAQRTMPGVLGLFQPARPVNDEDQNVYVFRITAADPAHQPASMDEVKDKVLEDWKRATAIDLAKQDAAKMLEAARTQGLKDAAGDRKMITTGFYSSNTIVPIENYQLSTKAQTTFVRDSFAMLSMLPVKEGTHPVAMVELPDEGKVAVTELIAVESAVNPVVAPLIGAQASAQIAQQYEMALSRSWFDSTSVIERVGYKDLAPRKPTAPQPAAPPDLLP